MATIRKLILGLRHDKFNEGSHSEVIRLFSEFEKTENTYVPISIFSIFDGGGESYLSLGVGKIFCCLFSKSQEDDRF